MSDPSVPARSTVGAVKESAAGERRVALVPDAVGRLTALGLDVLIEAGAGAAAFFPDAAYVQAGAAIVSATELYEKSDVVLCVGPPEPAPAYRPGQVLLGLLQPLTRLSLVGELAEAKVIALSLDGLPRTLSRAQSMDALTSQANVAGYKAALVAADSYGGYFPMLMTAAGTVRPAAVLVLGAGVAGLQAISTSRRLGAVVSGYDVRPAARDDIAATGAAFLDLGEVSGEGAGGYARALDHDEQEHAQAALAAALARFDVVITTAQVPGRRPPLLVPEAALAALAPGSVVVDLAAGPDGGNVAGSVAGHTVVTAGGVTVIGADNLAAAVPRAASTAYARNLAAMLAHLFVHGELVIDPADEITAGVLVCQEGQVVHPSVLALLDDHRSSS